MLIAPSPWSVHLLREVIGACCVGVHARALAHRLQSRKDLNGIGVILAHEKANLLFSLLVALSFCIRDIEVRRQSRNTGHHLSIGQQI